MIGVNEYTIHEEIPSELDDKTRAALEKEGFMAIVSDKTLHVWVNKEKVSQEQLALYIGFAIARELDEITAELSAHIAAVTCEVICQMM